MTSVPIPVINKENNKLIPSTYKSKLILREGTQFTPSIIVCPELVIGNNERKYKNKAKGKIKTNQPVCMFLMYLYKNGISKTIKKGARIAQCKKDKDRKSTRLNSS